ncbi:hypothetical protein [Paenisporosarcina sp. TG20]|uniref:hypothetical protein n=1 Tax=Paenisporosarcina sp. TG20 TaxID=1211706 RepID=UPI00036D88E4|nr:hypothetical protein [Paenisporosarcina sp. TG20]
MLSFFDKYQSMILTVILIGYILNSLYIGSANLSFVLFFLVVILQVVRMRKHILQLSFLQLLAIFGLIVGSIVALIFIFMGFNHMISVGILSFPNWMLIFIQIALILIILLSVTAMVRNLFERFTGQKAK